MATNKILPWAQTGTANVLSDDAYAADVATGGLYGDGVKAGQASSQQANKTWRQATAPGSGLGQFLVDNLNVDVTDADTPATFSTRIANAILKLAQISPFNQSWATATGGYRKYAIVSDSSGNYWSSTADQNVTVPGASGANWQSLFNGYATQAWANGQFLKLADSAEQTVSGPVTFSGVFSKDAPAGSNAQIQVTAGGSDRWNFGRDGVAETGTSTGSNFVIARFDNSGNYIDSPFGINRETGVVSANVGMEVPDISTFDGKDALNAVTAEGRYVRSVPAAGGTNIRIVDVQEDANGNLIATDANGNLLTFNQITQGVYPDGTVWRQIGSQLEMWFELTLVETQYSPVYTFPVAFSAPPYCTVTPQDGKASAGHVAFGGAAAGYPTATQIQGSGIGGPPNAALVGCVPGTTMQFYVKGEI